MFSEPQRKENAPIQSHAFTSPRKPNPFLSSPTFAKADCPPRTLATSPFLGLFSSRHPELASSPLSPRKVLATLNHQIVAPSASRSLFSPKKRKPIGNRNMKDFTPVEPLFKSPKANSKRKISLFSASSNETSPRRKSLPSGASDLPTPIKSVPGHPGVYILGSIPEVKLPLNESQPEEGQYWIRLELHDTIGRVSVGERHGLLISKDRQCVWSFGDQSKGALGRSGDGSLLQRIEGLEGCSIKETACGDHISAILTNEGVLYTMGTFLDRQGHAHAISHIPLKVTAIKDPIRHIAAGSNAFYAVTKSGSLYTWGLGPALGHDTSRALRSQRSTTHPRRIVLEYKCKGKRRKIKWTRIFAGATCAFGIDDEGQVWAFGDNTFGQLGLGDQLSRSVPEKMDWTFGAIKSISCGLAHTLFLTKDGQVYACGKNDQGQLGLGEKVAYVHRPTLVSKLVSHISFIACAGQSSMVTSQKGDLWTFGISRDFSVDEEVQFVPTLWKKTFQESGKRIARSSDLLVDRVVMSQSMALLIAHTDL